jgi:flavodoxin
MNILVTYWSQTGNTRKIAEIIFNSLPDQKELIPFDEVDTLDGFDLMFIGFPVMQFGPPARARKFMSNIPQGNNIALFVTHAMLSNSDDQANQTMLEKELSKCKAIGVHANLLGLFHCQGELSEKMADELNASGIPMFMEFAAMRPATLGHPDAGEIKLAAEFATSILNAS